jgi:hypothetical protein
MSVLKSFIAVKNAIVQPVKDGSNPQFKSNYVTLDGVVKAVDDAIKTSQAEFGWYQEIKDNVVYTIITDGENVLPLAGFPLLAVQNNRSVPLEGATPQALGSGLTYAKRYSLAMAFGITSDVDDDGNGAQSIQPHQANNQKQTNPLHSEFGKLSKSLQKKNNIEETQIFAELAKVSGLPIKQFYDFVKLSDQQKQQLVATLKSWVEN